MTSYESISCQGIRFVKILCDTCTPNKWCFCYIIVVYIHHDCLSKIYFVLTVYLRLMDVYLSNFLVLRSIAVSVGNPGSS